MKKTVILLCLLFAVFLLNACQTTGIETTPVISGETPLRVIPVDVVSEYIAPQALVPQVSPPDDTNLFDNVGFEIGLNGWTGCEAGAIAESNDAYAGSKALKLNEGNCFYRSVEVSAGQDLVLSCYARLESGTGWTGMGLGFADASWTTIPGGPSTIITGNTYQRYDLEATVPAGSKYVSMWMYSDNPAVVDNCSLMLEVEPPPPPPSSGDNLLDNGDFQIVDGNDKPVNWTKGCGGYWSSVNVNGTKGMRVNGNACVDQSLSATDINSLKGKDYTYACYVNNTNSYASMTIFLDGVQKSTVIPFTNNSYQLVEVKGNAGQISSGFVSLYASGSMFVDYCELKVDGIDPPPPPPSGDNLLENGDFESLNANNKPNNWTKGCGGHWSHTTANGWGLNVGGGACIDQSLSTADVAALSGQNYTYSCYAKNVSGYASISIFLDGEQKSQTIPVSNSLELVEINGQAGQVSSGFVSIYSEGDIVIDDCSLTVEGGGPVTGTPSIDVRNNLEGPDSYALNGPYTFEVAVRNNGDVALENVSLTSDKLSCDTTFPTLAVGEIKSIACTSQVSVRPTEPAFTHTVTATANTSDGRSVSDADAASYIPSYRATGRVRLNIVPDSEIVPLGSDVTFTVSVANTGNVGGITGITSNVADCTRQFTSALSSGDIQVYECTALNVQNGFIANIEATTTGGYLSSSYIASTVIYIEDSVEIDVRVNAEGDDTTIVGNLPLSYRVTIRNSGQADLQNIQVSSATIPSCQSTINNLAIGQVQAFTCNSDIQLADREVFAHVVDVVAENSDGRQASDSDVGKIAYRPKPEATFDLKVNGQDSFTANGQVFEVALTITNTGDAEILTIGLFDWRATSPDAASNSVAVFELCPNEYPRRSLNSSEPAVDFVLAVGQSKTFTCIVDRAPFLTKASEIRVAGTVWAGRDVPNLFFATNTTFDVVESP